MTYLFKKGKITAIDKTLNIKRTIYVEDFNCNVNVVVDKKYANSTNFDLEIYCDKPLEISQFIKLRNLIKRSYRIYEESKRRQRA